MPRLKKCLTIRCWKIGDVPVHHFSSICCILNSALPANKKLIGAMSSLSNVILHFVAVLQTCYWCQYKLSFQISSSLSYRIANGHYQKNMAPLCLSIIKRLLPEIWFFLLKVKNILLYRHCRFLKKCQNRIFSLMSFPIALTNMLFSFSLEKWFLILISDF